jgi:TonB family protein
MLLGCLGGLSTVSHRLAELDATYRRRIALATPSAILVLLLALISVPREYFLMPNPTVGMRGPLRILPEIDIITEREEDTDLTAAPAQSPRSDFIAIEIDYAIVPESPEPVAIESPPKQEKVETEVQVSSAADNVQDAAQTTSHPILAETEYELVYMARPIYPRDAANAGIEGNVLVMMLVDRQGHVSQAHVINPNQHPLLEAAAMAAMFKSVFRPHIVNGVATPFWIRIPFEFRLAS